MQSLSLNTACYIAYTCLFGVLDLTVRYSIFLVNQQLYLEISESFQLTLDFLK